MLRRRPRAKPASVNPAVRAVATASADGALTATTVPNPAAHAFWTISKLARPETNSTSPAAGRRPSSRRRPTTLSTALWRPMSSRTTSGSPVGSTAAAAWAAPVDANTPWPARTRSGTAARTARGTGAVAGSGARRVARWASVVEPQRPHDDVVVLTRAGGTGARASVSTVTTLKPVSTAEAVAQ